jgi:hypothetical protein
MPNTSVLIKDRKDREPTNGATAEQFGTQDCSPHRCTCVLAVCCYPDRHRLNPFGRRIKRRTGLVDVKVTMWSHFCQPGQRKRISDVMRPIIWEA